jgi:hypothetical protein
MVMLRLLTQILSLPIAIVVAITLISCGGGSSSGDNSSTNDTSNTTAESTGTVGILLTDKPADPSLFLSMNATIEQVELLGPDGEDAVVLYSDEPQTVDLLRLRNESIPLTFRDDVPVGTYCKIRLILSDLELILVDDTPDDLTDNERYYPDLPGNGKIDLLVRDCFSVEEGNVITVQIDLDGGNSIHIIENSHGYNFRPVVFVDVLEEGFESRLVRLEGEISEIYPEENALLLCDALPVQRFDSMACVEVHLGEDSAFFDNLNYAGGPRSLDELLTEAMLGQQVVVVGKPDHAVDPHSGEMDIPPGHLPPPGECRLWEEGVAPGQQTPSDDCESLEEEVSDGDDTVLVDHHGVVSERYHPLMEVDALVVELGEFLQLEGSVSRDADSSGFAMAVSSGEGIETDAEREVLLQAGEQAINGTRIVSKSGELLDTLDIVSPLQLQVDGVMDSTGATEVLNAALVIVDSDSENEHAESNQVTGTVLSVGTNGFVLTPSADTACGVVTTDLNVTLADEVELLTVVISETVNEISQGGTLEAGQNVGINGRCIADGYLAETVVIVDDQRTL